MNSVAPSVRWIRWSEHLAYRWFLSGFAGRDALLGDLREHVEESIRTGEPTRRAFRDYWQSVLSVVLHRTLDTLRTRTPPIGQRLHNRRGPGNMFRQITNELRIAARSLRRQPGFSLIVIITLALGVGANSAVFTVVKAVLLAPLPFDNPEQLADVWLEFREDPGVSGFRIPASGPEFVEFKNGTTSFASVAGYVTSSVNVGSLEQPERAVTAWVTPNFFPTLGANVERGTDFSQSDPSELTGSMAIITYGWWQSAFGGQDVLGQTIEINGRANTIVGILEPTFQFPGASVSIIKPLLINEEEPGRRSSHGYSMIARLRDGVTHAAAALQTQALMEAWDAEFPGRHGGSPNHPVVIGPLHDSIVGEARPPLMLLTAGALAVLLIACVNVGNLMFARAEARSHEVALRRALGSSRLRVILSGVSEAVVIGVVGGVVGVGMAWVGVPLLVALGPSGFPRLSNIHVDLTVIAFTLGVAGLSGLILGAVPALVSSGASVHRATSRTTASRSRQWIRRTLVVAELSLAVLLVTGATLLLRSLTELQRVDPGFIPDGVAVLSFSLDSGRYPSADQVEGFHTALLARLEAMPQVSAAGLVKALPLQAGLGIETVTISGSVPRGGGHDMEGMANAQYQIVSPGYFEALGVRLLQGRRFDRTDGNGAPPVVIVNSAMAKEHWPNGDAIGQTLQLGAGANNANPVMTIVGIVDDVLQTGLNGQIEPQFFVTHSQARAVYNGSGTRNATLVVRSSGDPSLLLNTARGAVRDIDPGLPVVSMDTMEGVVAASTTDQRFIGTLMLVFSAVALILGTVGVYGLVSLVVNQQSREIGIRMALGATTGRVFRHVVHPSALMALAGIVIGLLGTLPLGNVIGRFLFTVTPHDPMAIAAASVCMMITALIAAAFPAHRAARIDPVVALRAD